MLLHIARFRVLLLATLALLASVHAMAGNGPMNVLIVANGNSKASLEVGNAYRRARKIPYNQLLVVKTTTELTISYRAYRDEIETPIKTYLTDARLDDTVNCIVLARGLPLKVEAGNGRSVASLLAAMQLPNRPAESFARLPNPYFNAVDAFTRGSFEKMYLVTVLDGYHTSDALHLVSLGLAADGSATAEDFAGRYLFHASPQFNQSEADLKKYPARAKTEVVTAPPADRANLMGYFSGGIYSGLTRDIISSFAFAPGAVVDMVQQYSAAPDNMKPGARPILLPAGLFLQAGATGLHGVVGEAGFDAFPLKAAPGRLLDKYVSGFSLSESLYSALPYLNWQNIIFGDPLASPYLKRPAVSVDTETGPLKGIVPVRVTASATAPGMTIGRVDLYVDDEFMQTIYEPEKTQIYLRIEEEVVIYTVPHGATLRTVLEGLAKAVNNDVILNAADGVVAEASPGTGSLVLKARNPGLDGNDKPINIDIKTEPPASPRISTPPLNIWWLSGGGQAKVPASATISFLGRRIKPGDQVLLQIGQEQLTCTVPDDPSFTVADIPPALARMINEHPKLQGAGGVTATVGDQRMPYLVLEARTAGEEGNTLTFKVTAKPVAGSALKVYHDSPSQYNPPRFQNGHNGSVASLAIPFMLGETIAKGRYLLNTADLADGYHTLRVVAFDGTLTQGQGSKIIPFMTRNQENPPVVSLPEKMTVSGSELTVPITAGESVASANIYIDGQLLGTSDAAPFEVKNIPLAMLGRGLHDLWAEGIDKAGNRYRSAPVPLEVLTSPEITGITPAFAGVTGGATHRIAGANFQPDCTVSLAGIAARAVRVLSPNLLEVVSDAAPAAGQGLVKVTNPDGTITASRVNFEYYTPLVSDILITPSREVLAPGQSVPFTTTCLDQHNVPIEAMVFWEPTGGTITPDGVYTAGAKTGSYYLRAKHPDFKKIREVPITIGPARITNGHLQHWLVLGSFPDPEYTALEKSQIPEETVQPSHGDAVEALYWRSLYSEGEFVNLDANLQPNDNVAAYAHVYIQAPAETACSLVYGSDDGIRIWLNGALVQSLRTRRNADPNQNTTPITLKAGWNRLLLKIDQGTASWGFYMRVLGTDGKALNDLFYALDKPKVE